MKKILFLILLFLFNINYVNAEFSYDEETLTCSYELKFNGANSFDRNILNSLGVKNSDGSPITYNSLILEITYPMIGGSFYHQMALEYRPERLAIYSLDARENKSLVFDSTQSEADTLDLLNNGLSDAANNSVNQVKDNRYRFFRTNNSENRITEEFSYGNSKSPSIASQLGIAGTASKYLVYTIEDAFINAGIQQKNATKEQLEQIMCGKELHVMTAFAYKGNNVIKRYAMPMVCGINSWRENGTLKSIDTCNAMYKNWEYYSNSTDSFYFAYGDKVIINAPSKYIYKSAGKVSYENIASDLEEEFNVYYKYCNYSKLNGNNYDMEKCRAQYGLIDGIIGSAIEFGFTKKELLEPIIKKAEKVRDDACTANNTSANCEKEGINFKLSQFEKIETTIEDAKNYAAKDAEYYCNQKDTCVNDCLDSNSDTCKGLSISNKKDATNYCTEMCNLSKSTDKHYEEAEKEKDKFEIKQLITNIKLNFDVGGCDSYLGNPNLKGEPAYYLQFIFNLMKYASIILLFVFTIVDFAKAVTSEKDDAIKKASSNAIKRLVIVVIIFFLPILIEFILKLLGIYSASTCGIK